MTDDRFQMGFRTALLGAVVGALGSIASGSAGVSIFRGAIIGFGIGGLAGFSLEPVVEKKVDQKLSAALGQTGLFGSPGI